MVLGDVGDGVDHYDGGSGCFGVFVFDGVAVEFEVWAGLGDEVVDGVFDVAHVSLEEIGVSFARMFWMVWRSLVVSWGSL